MKQHLWGHGRRLQAAWILGPLFLCIVSAGAGADETFLDEGRAPVALFGAGAIGTAGTLHLDDAELHQLDQAVQRRVDQRDYPCLVIHRGADAGPGEVIGAIFILEVVGQTLPITFAVGVRTDLALQDLQIMVYREPYGKEIEEPRFRAQFRGKTVGDPLTVEKDIQAVSGATISSRSATYAARKGLALAAILRQRGWNPTREQTRKTDQ